VATKKSKKHNARFLKIIGIVAPAIFAGIVFYGTIIVIFNILTPASLIYMRVLFGLGLIGTISLVLDKLHSTSLSRFFHYTAISVACIILATHIFSDLFPNYKLYVASFIGGTAVFAHALPIWNPKTANLIRRELVSPKTNPGRFILYVSIALIPIIGFVASLLASLLNKTGNSPLVINIIGTLSWFVALIAPYSNISSSSPWE